MKWEIHTEICIFKWEFVFLSLRIFAILAFTDMTPNIVGIHFNFLYLTVFVFCSLGLHSSSFFSYLHLFFSYMFFLTCFKGKMQIIWHKLWHKIIGVYYLPLIYLGFLPFPAMRRLEYSSFMHAFACWCSRSVLIHKAIIIGSEISKVRWRNILS